MSRRYSRGSGHMNAKLTEALVRELRADRRGGEKVTSICARTGLSIGTVSPMLKGKTWKHVS